MISFKSAMETEKIAASKLHNIEGTLLEKINSKEFKEYMSTINERVNIMTFESMMNTAFVEITENEDDYWQELQDFEDWYVSPTDLDIQKEAIYNAYTEGEEDVCKDLIKNALVEIFPNYVIPKILVDYSYDVVDQVG